MEETLSAHPLHVICASTMRVVADNIDGLYIMYVYRHCRTARNCFLVSVPCLVNCFNANTVYLTIVENTIIRKHLKYIIARENGGIMNEMFSDYWRLLDLVQT